MKTTIKAAVFTTLLFLSGVQKNRPLHAVDYLLSSQRVASTMPIRPVNLEEHVMFTDNPFHYVNELPVEGRDSLNYDAFFALIETAKLGEEKFRKEQELLNDIGWMRTAFKNPRYNEEIKEFLKKGILTKSEYYGRILTNKKYRRSYDPSLTLEDTATYHLDWTDCTKSVFEDFEQATGDTTIINDYLRHVGEHKYLTVFPRNTAKYLHEQGYELIYVAVDTKARKKANKYWAGGRKRVHAKKFYQEVLRKNYYADIDYVVRDQRVNTPSFKKFLEITPAILFLEEFVHVATNYHGNMVDASWNANPLKENNFRKRNLYDLLTVEQEDTKDNIRSMVMVVPRGSVERFVENYIKDAPVILYAGKEGQQEEGKSSF